MEVWERSRLRVTGVMVLVFLVIAFSNPAGTSIHHMHLVIEPAGKVETLVETLVERCGEDRSRYIVL